MSDRSSWLAYVGCRTTRERNATGRGLTVFRIGLDGTWTQLQTVEGLPNPSYLCLHPIQARLYAVHGDFSEISTFAIDADGQLTHLAMQGTQGSNPVHLALTPSGHWLLVANYASGNVASMRVSDDGALGSVAHVLRLPGGSHPHQVCVAPDGRHALVPDKGLDAVFALAVNEETGHMRIAATSPLPPGSGPRHMVFHPDCPLAYVVGELARVVLTAWYDGATGRLEVTGSVSSVPAGVEHGSAAGIVLTEDRGHLLVSNRGHDSVASFPLDGAGRLGVPSWIPAGRTPRFIAQSPVDGGIVVAREDGHSIATLQGGVPPFHDLAQTGSPVCVAFRKANP